MNTKSDYILGDRLRRAIALATVFFFIATSLSLPPAYAGSAASSTVQGGNPIGDLLTAAKFSKVAIPPEHGDVLETHQGTSTRTVVLIQDAHDIPQAQESIRSLIAYFQDTDGIDLVALEGTAGKLDAQIFRSFPDAKTLGAALKPFHEKGELTGPVEAAILNKRPGNYQGIEDWSLYEEGLRLYRQAAEKEPALLQSIAAKQAANTAAKKNTYAAALWEIDQSMERFLSEQDNVSEALLKLAAVERPKQGSRLGILLEEIERSQAQDPKIAAEGGTLVQKSKEFLAASASAVSVEHQKEFNTLVQELETSRITPQGFALRMSVLAAAIKMPFEVSAEMDQLIQSQKRIEALKGTEFMNAMKGYAAHVKGTLFRTPEEKALDAESETLRFLRDLARLELRFEDWQKLQPVIAKKAVLTAEDWQSLESHILFYKNATARDQAFMKNLERISKGRAATGKDGRPRPAIVVAGGFHTEGLIKQFKALGISYLLIAPRMTAVPKETGYRAHMQGDVSWKNYFKVENGRVDLYGAFVRATRDKLLAPSVERTVDRELNAKRDPLSAKAWRDQIIRDLAERLDAHRKAAQARFGKDHNPVMVLQLTHSGRYSKRDNKHG